MVPNGAVLERRKQGQVQAAQNPVLLDAWWRRKERWREGVGCWRLRQVCLLIEEWERCQSVSSWVKKRP